MYPMLVAVCVLLASPPPPNLLLNPDFEAVDLQGMPAPWALYVLPYKGASGRVDSVALEGNSSVLLHTPVEYPTEPANNWSQVLITDAASKELHLRGFIRTEEATDAALWIQCFSQNPAQVIAAQTSSLETPVRGTSDWTAVEVSLTAPKKTDFVVVRCVLTGTGKAWFDSVRLWVGEDEMIPLDALEPAEEVVDPEPDDTLAQNVMALSESIRESMRELEAANAVLLEQIESIRRGLALNQRPVPLIPSDISSPLLEPLSTGPTRHPLVPHGYVEGID